MPVLPPPYRVNRHIFPFWQYKKRRRSSPVSAFDRTQPPLPILPYTHTLSLVLALCRLRFHTVISRAYLFDPLRHPHHYRCLSF
jgi:hypothetical protein